MKKFFSYLLLVCFFSFQLHGYEYENFSIKKTDLGSSLMYTIDLRITEEVGSKSDYLIDVNYSNIREEGTIMQTFYSNALGKAQWVPFPFSSNIYIMPNSLLLPISRWMEQGMKTDGTWWVRIVMLIPNTQSPSLGHFPCAKIDWHCTGKKRGIWISYFKQ